MRTRTIILVLISVALFLLKRQYTGPFAELVQCYWGNLIVSFAVYFNTAMLPFPGKDRRLPAAFLAFTAVQLFEATDGFGFMSNTYDPLDYLANTIGITLALLLDTLFISKQTTRTR